MRYGCLICIFIVHSYTQRLDLLTKHNLVLHGCTAFFLLKKTVAKVCVCFVDFLLSNCVTLIPLLWMAVKPDVVEFHYQTPRSVCQCVGSVLHVKTGYLNHGYNIS